MLQETLELDRPLREVLNWGVRGVVLVTQLCLTLCDPMNCSRQAPLSMGFSREEHWSGWPCPPPGDLPSPGTEPGSPTLQADSLPSEPLGMRGLGLGTPILTSCWICGYPREICLNWGDAAPFFWEQYPQPAHPGSRGNGCFSPEARSWVVRKSCPLSVSECGDSKSRGLRSAPNWALSWVLEKWFISFYVHACSVASVVSDSLWLFATLWTVARQISLPVGIL